MVNWDVVGEPALDDPSDVAAAAVPNGSVTADPIADDSPDAGSNMVADGDVDCSAPVLGDWGGVVINGFVAAAAAAIVDSSSAGSEANGSAPLPGEAVGVRS